LLASGNNHLVAVGADQQLFICADVLQEAGSKLNFAALGELPNGGYERWPDLCMGANTL
jgi:hypothetical protein